MHDFASKLFILTEIVNSDIKYFGPFYVCSFVQGSINHIEPRQLTDYPDKIKIISYKFHLNYEKMYLFSSRSIFVKLPKKEYFFTQNKHWKSFNLIIKII